MKSPVDRVHLSLKAGPQGRARVRKARAAAGGLRDANHGRGREARVKLLALSEAAIPALLDALEDPDAAVRWQAAKILGGLRAPEVAPYLVNTLEDDDFGVRWLAADGLIAMGPACLEALLAGLQLDSFSQRKRAGVQHVLCALADGGYYDETIERLLQVLRDSHPAAEIAWIVERAMGKLQTGGMRI
jgi:HEAT repeat protein